MWIDSIVNFIRTLSIRLDLICATMSRSIFLNFQPIRSNDESNISMREVFIRWHCPIRGIRSPALFIEKHENTNTTWLISLCVIKHIVRALDKKQIDGRLFINVSPSCILNKKVAIELDNLKCMLEQMNCNLVLEITERQHLKNIHTKALSNLRKKGFEIAIDDFGAGCVSFNDLDELEIDYIKIDKSITNSVCKNKLNLISKIVIKARDINAKVIAEGVETEVQKNTLNKFGVDFQQGNHLGKPTPSLE